MFFKKKIGKKVEKYDCKKRGHEYEVIRSTKVIEAPAEKPVGVALYLECEHCKERIIINSSYGTFNKITELWEKNKISSNEMKKLSDITKEKWEEVLKEYDNKHNKKPSKTIKKNRKKKK